MLLLVVASVSVFGSVVVWPNGGMDLPEDVLGVQGKVVRHMGALPHGEVASAIETVRESGGRPVVKLAFEFFVLTATRSGEVRGTARKPSIPICGSWTL